MVFFLSLRPFHEFINGDMPCDQCSKCQKMWISETEGVECQKLIDVICEY
jgi:hypothetical protein